MIWARKLGIEHVDRVRILIIDRIPVRNRLETLVNDLAGPAFRSLGKQIGGMTTGYGILVAKNFESKDWLVAHELVHVRQFEELGREAMLKRVLTEHHILPNNLIPLEREAISESSKLLDDKVPDYQFN